MRASPSHTGPCALVSACLGCCPVCLQSFERGVPWSLPCLPASVHNQMQLPLGARLTLAACGWAVLTQRSWAPRHRSRARELLPPAQHANR